MVQKTSPQTRASEFENKMIEFLSKQGYEVTRQVTLPGKSGIEQVFNLVARLDDGLANYAIAININAADNREAQLRAVFDFANAAYDAGIRQKMLGSVFALDSEAKNLAQRQGIRPVDAAQLETALALKPKRMVKSTKPLAFENKAQLLDALTERGYKFEEKSSVLGRSGTEYVFDLLTYREYSLVSYSLAIDIINGDVNLSDVSLFDTKSFDAGVDYKAIGVSGKVTEEARQFADHQQIKLIEPKQKSVSEKATDKGLSVSAAKKPGETNKPQSPANKQETKKLKQMPQPDALLLIPEVMARRYNAIPVTISDGTLLVAMANPTDIFCIEAFAAQSRKRIRVMAATPEDVRDAIDFNYKAIGEIEKQISRVSINNETDDDKLVFKADAPLVQALNLIIEEAAKTGASDIHIEPEENRLRIRYRIDGVLHDTMSLPLTIHRAIISRLKIMSGMNIADHYRAQDGQFSVTSKDRALDVRVATVATVWGEMAVLRLLDKSMPARGLSQIGMLPETLDKYERILKNPYGMILVSGPTGSGKTTTLYSSIGSMDTISRNIITIEDPAEYRFKDINQIQVNTQAGITFASGLRSILRLDPDVILVGEVRDQETANIAVQSALTGHLVLTSIHANDSVGTLFRLLDLGVEAYLIASAIIGVVAQRMVRRICPDCSRMLDATVSEQIAYEKVLGEKLVQAHYGTGCASCSYTGYRGRIGIFEILPVSDKVMKMLAGGSSKSEIQEQALKDGMMSIITDGMVKVKAGITTPSEVLRATHTQE